MNYGIPVRKLLKALFGTALLIVAALAAVSSSNGVKPLEAATGTELGSAPALVAGGCSAEVTCGDFTRRSCSAGVGETCKAEVISCSVPPKDPGPIQEFDRGGSAYVECGGVRHNCPCIRISPGIGLDSPRQ